MASFGRTSRLMIGVMTVVVCLGAAAFSIRTQPLFAGVFAVLALMRAWLLYRQFQSNR